MRFDFDRQHIGLLRISIGVSSKPEHGRWNFNPKKSELVPLHIIWCGRKIFKDGVSSDPAYLKGLTELPLPETAKQLQHLLSGLNALEAPFQTMPVTRHQYKNS